MDTLWRQWRADSFPSGPLWWLEVLHLLQLIFYSRGKIHFFPLKNW